MTRPNPREIILPVEREGTSRRTFLKRAGFGVAAATLAGCSRAPVRYVVPRLEGIEGHAPGRPYWIATTCGGCPAGCGALARCVDGRPVKLEGAPGHPVSSGGLCAVGQAQVLSLYDSQRLASPRTAGAATTWDAADAAVRAKLDAAHGKVRLLTGTVTSPSTRAWIRSFVRKFGAEHVAYDALSASAILDAHAATHGIRALPRYRFERARVIASFGADFLGTWISPVEFTAGWRAGRPLAEGAAASSKHWQIEARASMTGLRADRRVRLGPWETGDALAELCDALAAKAGSASRIAAGVPRPWIAELADDLWAARGASIVVCDDGDTSVQVLVNAANQTLANYGATIDLDETSRVRGGDDAALRSLIAEMGSGAVGVLVVAGCNPAYDLPADAGFVAAVARVPFVAVLAPMHDETASLAHVALPELHALESWNDAEPVTGVLCLTQPAIRPLRAARTLRECLARWTGDANADAIDDAALLREHWRATVFVAAGGAGAFEPWYDRALRDGFVRVPAPAVEHGPLYRPEAVKAAAARTAPGSGRLALVLYAKAGLLDGSQAHNAWLQELPDPVSKTTWDNYACLAPETAAMLGVATGEVVRITADGVPPLELPALVQEGQHAGVVAVAVGYGRRGTDRFALAGPDWLEAKPTVAEGGTVGRNAAPFLVLDERGLRTSGRDVRVERTGARHDLACTQDHHSLHVPAHLAPRRGEVREAVRTLAFAEVGRSEAHEPGHGDAAAADLWPADHPTPVHKWGMVVDLAACSGCSACVVACQAENNIPVVGKDEVLRHREMQWMRIDRYYEGEGDDVSASQQPMMCQHCANAPCETVCPVLATVHSSEGLNQQVYNRCVGTRYCANNCPYKTRRFNWFDYPREDALQNLGLNPDVTVRTRGVMEKCSLCVQRIQAGKSDAKQRGIGLVDGDIRTACQQSCPAGAIVFGDLNDARSEVSKRAAGGRAYQVLGELNVKPAVTYLADVRNRPARKEEGGHVR